MYHFFKYQATGNDFILFDNRKNKLEFTEDTVIKLCDRHFGIGADGIILLNNDDFYDFQMMFYNPDGTSGMMCGNGGRAIVAFARDLGIIYSESVFTAPDGKHKAYLKDNTIKLQLRDVEQFEVGENYYFLNTGTLHHVIFCEKIEEMDILSRARTIRYSDKYMPEGVNVNFVEIQDNETVKIRTYEKGVENETLSCGTGMVAAAISFALKTNFDGKEVYVNARGGSVKVFFDRIDGTFTNIFLEGNVERIFEGDIYL